MRCAEEARELKAEGYEPIFKHARWLRAKSSISHFKILIIDEDNAFRKAISGFLREQFSAIKIREAGNYREALRHTDDLDLVFVEYFTAWRKRSGLAAKLKSKYPDLVVSILTIHDSLEYREAAFQCGVDYFVSKAAPEEEIRRALAPHWPSKRNAICRFSRWSRTSARGSKRSLCPGKAISLRSA